MTYAYLHWSLTREALEAPLALWERVLLFALFTVLGVGLIALVVAGLVLGFTVDWLFSMVQTPAA